MATVPEPLGNRDRDLDWIKGLACIGMLLLHTIVMVGVPPHHWLWTLQFEIIHQFYAWFFMASGMNVVRAAQKDMGTDWKRTATSYLLVTLALFVLGVFYSINRRTLGQMELFQGVAACTAVTYILLRRRWPNWALLTIAILLFGTTVDWAYFYYGHLPADRISTLVLETFNPAVAREFPFAMMDKQQLFNLLVVYDYPLWVRFLFVHFSLLPWVSWFLLGAVVMNWVDTKYEKFLWVMFAAFLALSFYPPWFVPRVQMDFFLRGKIDFLFRSSAMAGLSILAAHRWYRSNRPINKRVEFIGRESFLIFILQWFTVDFFGLPMQAIAMRTGLRTWYLFPVAQALTIFITYRLTRYFAARRDAQSHTPRYLRFWGIYTLVLTLITWWLYVRRPIASWLLSYALIVGVGMLFPALRLVIRRALKPPRPATANP